MKSWQRQDVSLRVTAAGLLHIGMDGMSLLLDASTSQCWAATHASNGFWEISIREEDRYKTVFTSSHGQYFYKSVSQGLLGAYEVQSGLLVGLVGLVGLAGLVYLLT